MEKRKNRGMDFYVLATEKLIKLSKGCGGVASDSDLFNIFSETDTELGYVSRSDNNYVIRNRLVSILGDYLIAGLGKRKGKLAKTAKKKTWTYKLQQNISEQEILERINANFRVKSSAVKEKVVEENKDKLKEFLSNFWVVLQAARDSKDNTLSLKKINSVWKGPRSLNSASFLNIKNKLSSYGINCNINIKNQTGTGEVVTFLDCTGICVKIDDLYYKNFGQNLQYRSGSRPSLVKRVTNIRSFTWDTKYLIFLIGGIINEVGRSVLIDDLIKTVRDNNFRRYQLGKNELTQIIKGLPDIFDINTGSNMVYFREKDSWKKLYNEFNPRNEVFDVYVGVKDVKLVPLANLQEEFPGTCMEFDNIIKIHTDRSYHAFKKLSRLFWDMKTYSKIIGNEELEESLINNMRYELMIVESIYKVGINDRIDSINFKNTRQIFRIEEEC